jgi:hypothetical protein
MRKREPTLGDDSRTPNRSGSVEPMDRVSNTEDTCSHGHGSGNETMVPRVRPREEREREERERERERAREKERKRERRGKANTLWQTT